MDAGSHQETVGRAQRAWRLWWLGADYQRTRHDSAGPSLLLAWAQSLLCHVLGALLVGRLRPKMHVRKGVKGRRAMHNARSERPSPSMALPACATLVDLSFLHVPSSFATLSDLLLANWRLCARRNRFVNIILSRHHNAVKDWCMDLGLRRSVPEVCRRKGSLAATAAHWWRR